MTGTRILRTAYDKSMEMFMILFILALSDKNPELKETLKSVLAFYRENRELLTLIANGTPAAASSAAPSEQKDPPAAEGERIKILEEFLKQRTV